MKDKSIVIFGGTGDLSYRKLFPALYNLHCLGELVEDYRIVGVGRRSYSQEEYIGIVQEWLKKFSRIKYTEEDFKRFSERIIYFEMDMTKKEEYPRLKEVLQKDVMYYYAVSPSLFKPITEGLKYAGGHRDAKVIIEKPFGEDIESAKKLYESLQSFFDKENIYHIDHYLGKEMIINIMALRFSNAIFSGVWNKDFIEKVEVNVFERVGVESRGGYYDNSGAMKDMIQNHLLQILSFVAMEQPERNSAEEIKKVQNEVFRRIKDIDPQNIDRDLVMAQYKGYRQEDKVAEDSKTETYVSLKLELDTPRWEGVPFILTTGKMLSERESEVVVYFKAMGDNVEGNKIRIKIQPDEGVVLDFNIKKPGSSNFEIEKVEMDFCQSCILENRINTPEAYERLIHAAQNEDRSLFSTWEQISLSWSYINRVVETYEKYSNRLLEYEPYSNGPIISE